jgi:hypothetical protein
MIINNKLANIINNHKELVKGLCDKFDILNNQITIGKVSFNDDLNDEDEDDFEEIDPENYI